MSQKQRKKIEAATDVKDGSHRAVASSWARRVATAEKLTLKRLVANTVDVVDEVSDSSWKLCIDQNTLPAWLGKP